MLENDLEKELETTPFETYKLWRGKKNSILGHRLAGIFKGLIRVKLTDNPADDGGFSEDLMKMLTKPKGYKVRCVLHTTPIFFLSHSPLVALKIFDYSTYLYLYLCLSITHVLRLFGIYH